MPSEYRKDLSRVLATILGNVAAASLIAGLVIPLLRIIERGWEPTIDHLLTFAIAMLGFLMFTWAAFSALRYGYTD